jgi:hypothetical protein
VHNHWVKKQESSTVFGDAIVCNDGRQRVQRARQVRTGEDARPLYSTVPDAPSGTHIAIATTSVAWRSTATGRVLALTLCRKRVAGRRSTDLIFSSRAIAFPRTNEHAVGVFALGMRHRDGKQRDGHARTVSSRFTHAIHTLMRASFSAAGSVQAASIMDARPGRARFTLSL